MCKRNRYTAGILTALWVAVSYTLVMGAWMEISGVPLMVNAAVGVSASGLMGLGVTRVLHPDTAR